MAKAEVEFKKRKIEIFSRHRKKKLEIQNMKKEQKKKT
jgi:hypothetical protein